MFETTGSRGSVLVCDDDADAREVITACLSQEGYNVCAVNGYDELRHLLISLEVDAILLDICMPDYDGFFVAETLRQTAGNNQTLPAIFRGADFRGFKNRVHAFFLRGINEGAGVDDDGVGV